MNKTKEAILKTLIYADVFDYPLTALEAWRWLVECNNVTMQQCNNAIEKLPKIDKKDGFFFLKGRDKIVELRKKREKWSRGKLKIAQKAASWLKLIPWIKMVGITGSLAMLNTNQDDDIDFLIVASTHRLWLTRFLATMIMEFLGKRRRPLTNEHGRVGLSIKDKICLNMYLDEDHLQVPKKEQDLFTAHEVIQVRLLWEKDKVYQKFLAENLWAKKYLPNATVEKNSPQPPDGHREGSNLPSPERKGQGEVILNAFEKLAKASQLYYMRKRRTTEVISDGVIRFHPKDARKWVLTRYRDSLKIALIQKE